MEHPDTHDASGSSPSPDAIDAQRAPKIDASVPPRAELAVPEPARVVAPPPAFADGAARKLEHGWIAASRFGGLVFFGVLSLFATFLLFGVFATGKMPIPVFLVVLLALGAVVALVLVLAALWPTWEYARAGYRILPDRIESWNGLLFRRAVSVPISRVQYTDVKQGPVQRRHGIATLVVHTAGTASSDVEFPGLPPALANEVRDWLVGQTGSDAV